jgi:hypothetical protein
MKKTVFFLLLCGVVTASRAGNGGSGYSRYGIGDLQYFVSDRAYSMGGAGVAVLSTSSIDRFNPADWVNITRTSFSVGALYEGYSTTDGVNSGYFSSANFNGIMIAFPLLPSHGVVLGAGLMPYSTVNYSTAFDTSQAGLAYRLGYHGEGGTSEAQVGISANASADLHLGAKFNYYFGTLRHTITQDFTDNSTYTNAEDLRSVELKGIGFSLGAVYSGLGSLLKIDSTKSLTLGIVASTASSLSSTEEHDFTYTTTALTSYDTATINVGNLRIPFSITGGISYMTNRFLLASDLSFQQWSRFEATGLIAMTNRNSYRFSIGGELHPPSDASGMPTGRTVYRLGFFYNSTYYLIANEPINETGVTGGMGIPIFFGTRLEIGVQYSFRGTTAQQLQKDKILRISFTLSGDELWFVQPPEE